DELTSRLAHGARVLELGCGGGVPDTQRLAAPFRLPGVGLSPKQIRRPRAAGPDAEFLCVGFTELELYPGSFEAVAAFYSFNHVPRELLPSLLARIHSWLVPGGLLLAAFGVSDTEAWVGDFLGALTFFSSFPAPTNSRLVHEAGFVALRDE